MNSAGLENSNEHKAQIEILYTTLGYSYKTTMYVDRWYADVSVNISKINLKCVYNVNLHRLLLLGCKV